MVFRQIWHWAKEPNQLRAMHLLWAGVKHFLTTPLALMLKIRGCNKQCKRIKRLMTTENNTDWPWLKHWTYKLTRVQVQFWTCLCACARTFSVCQTDHRELLQLPQALLGSGSRWGVGNCFPKLHTRCSSLGSRLSFTKLLWSHLGRAHTSCTHYHKERGQVRTRE